MYKLSNEMGEPATVEAEHDAVNGGVCCEYDNKSKLFESQEKFLLNCCCCSACGGRGDMVLEIMLGDHAGDRQLACG